MIFVSVCLTIVMSLFAANEQRLAIATTSNATKNDTFKLLQSSSDWLFAQPRQLYSLNSTESIDAKLLDVLKRIGPDMKPASGFRDYDDISVDVSIRAWQLMRERIGAVANEKISTLWPSIEQTLVESNVSEKCVQAARNVASGAGALDFGATQLLNSWGSFPPSGLFEGTLGDIGSYHGCVNILENKYFNHAHYCTIAFRPIVPNRRDYELLFKKEPSDLLKTFSASDTFHSLVGKAQYYHYVYFKLGTCFPIDCAPIDVQKIVHLIAQRWYLMSGPVKCHSKQKDDYNEEQPDTRKALILSSKDLNNGVYIWKPHMTRTQLVALVSLSVLILLLALFTVTDLLYNRIPAVINRYFSGSREIVINNQVNASSQNAQSIVVSPKNNISRVSQNGERVAQDSNNNYRQIELDVLYEQIDSSKERSVKQSLSPDTSNKMDQSSNKSLTMQLIKDCSIITNTREFFTISDEQIRNDILCMNGLRCITMSWIIIAHTIQYNDWSAFARIYEVETHLKSLINQPLFNGSYLVDTFFLISGLLTSYSVFRSKIDARNDRPLKLEDFKANLSKFSCRTYLIGRYLRLTPQILLVSILFILLPLLSQSGGPHWYTMTGEYSENCAKNWWINLLHIQAFYKPDEMCNFVCWWISVDMFYHTIALMVILMIFNLGPRIVVKLISVLISINLIIQASQHYNMNLPPNLFSTIPQTGAMWSDMTLKFFWTPVAHVFPFLFGFYTGYKLANIRSHWQDYKSWFTPRRTVIGWILSISSFVLVLYGTYFWVIGEAHYSHPLSTIFYITTQMIWSLSVAWIIIACEFGFGGFIAQILSCKLFLVLGKASYLVYLSHFIILFTFFGSQNLLVEPTQLMITYIVIGNICLSMVFGSLLCIVFEMPWLKLQRRIMSKIR